MNEYPGINTNIYKNDIDLETAKKNNQNLTFINLGECGDKLKEYYNLNSSQRFCIISVDLLSKFSNKSTFDFNFELYLDNGTQIEDLSPCYDYPITISSSIYNLNIVNFNSAVIFNEQGYDIYNLSSDFYNDECSAANINGNDIIIKDRLSDIYPYNISFCPNGCELLKTEIEQKRFNCSCNISFINGDLPPNESEEIKINIQTNENYFAYLLDMVNYKVFRCSKIINKSEMKDIFINIGFYLGNIIILFNTVNFIIFFCDFFQKIRITMNNLMPNKKKLLDKAKEYKNKNKNDEKIYNPTKKKTMKFKSKNSINKINVYS